MTVSAQPPFITKDGSTIRSIETHSLATSLAATHRGFAFYVAFPKSSILDRTNAPVQNQSLAEARVPAGGRTERHYHKFAEELCFILEGAGEMELNGKRQWS
jgi:mannose-6-phosphate isomerase-like protein (cupin superfamily)